MRQAQRPLELILARNLITNLSTPALLTDEEGLLVFLNPAAADLLACDLERASEMGSALWEKLDPLDDRGQAMKLDDLPLAAARREKTPAHGRLRIRAFDGHRHEIEVSALPILTSQGARGAMAFFWTMPSSAGDSEGA